MPSPIHDYVVVTKALGHAMRSAGARRRARAMDMRVRRRPVVDHPGPAPVGLFDASLLVRLALAQQQEARLQREHAQAQLAEAQRMRRRTAALAVRLERVRHRLAR